MRTCRSSVLGRGGRGYAEAEGRGGQRMYGWQGGTEATKVTRKTARAGGAQREVLVLVWQVFAKKHHVFWAGRGWDGMKERHACRCTKSVI